MSIGNKFQKINSNKPINTSTAKFKKSKNLLIIDHKNKNCKMTKMSQKLCKTFLCFHYYSKAPVYSTILNLS